mgnify:FL=1
MRYRIFTWADITACVIVIALLLFVFIYPYCLSWDYYELFYDKQQRVLECTREENWGEAQKLMEAMAADFYVKRDSMRFFYDHEDIDEIEGYILSAQELILREESEQSASELMHALIVADFLRGIQSFDMPNLF